MQGDETGLERSAAAVIGATLCLDARRAKDAKGALTASSLDMARYTFGAIAAGPGW